MGIPCSVPRRRRKRRTRIMLHGRMLPLDGKHSLVSTKPFQKHSEHEPVCSFCYKYSCLEQAMPVNFGVREL